MMFIDTLAFQNKAAIFKGLIEAHMFSDLPSYREGQIQVEKLQRMTVAFDKKFPVELFTSLPKKKFDKMRGAERHKVNQQCKIVDKVFMKLMEEMAAAATGGILPKGKLRGNVQKFVHQLNSKIYKAHQKAMKDAYASLRDISELRG